MVTSKDEDSLGNKLLCFRCVGDAFLSRRIELEGVVGRCSYCFGDDDEAFCIDKLADLVSEAFEQHYERTPPQPDAFQTAMLANKESSYEWDRAGDPAVDAIADAASIQSEPASDIREVLDDRYSDWDAAMFGEETEFDGESHYSRKLPGGGRWLREWRMFESSLKTEARFFSRTVARHLDELFQGLDTVVARGNKPVFVSGGPGQSLASLYRARSFPRYQDIDAALARPDLHLGPPPANVARAGRMNAHGISVFYGASDPLVALAEVRPPVGCSVAIARFEIIRPVQLLDLTALRNAMSLGSVFDPTFLDRLQRAAFLRELGDRITVPVMPDDEGLGYLVTQVIADFLATLEDPAIDGIVFPSVQAKGEARNVVLFHKACRVRPIDLPPGTRIEVNDGYSTEDGWETDYSVFEYEPGPTQNTEPARTGQSFDPEGGPSSLREPVDPDPRVAALAVDPQSVEVHAVEAVGYKTTSDKVRRHRMRDQESRF